MPTLTEKDTTSSSDLSDNSSKYRFGVFGVQPKVMQKCNNAFMACFWLTIAKILSTVLTAGVVGATLPHVEKRFGFTSRQSSIFIAIFDFASVPALLLACVLGAQCHKPRAIAVGMLMLSLSCIITVMPHFFSTTYMPKLQSDGNESTILCGDKSDFKECSKVGTQLISTTHWALAALILARILCAFGNTPLNTLAYNYMHDVAPKEQFNIAVAALNMSMMVGTAIGYLAGAATLNLPHTWPGKPDFPRSNPNFVGAWWLSYIVIAIATAVVALPIAAFPRDIPGAEQMRRNRKTEAHKGQEDDETAIFVHWRDIGGHAKRLVKNAPYVALALYYSVNYSTTNGFADFAPKLVQTGFGLSAPKAAIAAGLTLVLSAPVGTIAATVCSNKLKLSCRTLITWVCVISTTVCLFAPTLLTPCQGTKLRVANETCSLGLCNCTDSDNQAVCGSDGFTYKSACHAGCTSTNSSMIFQGCHCISSSSRTAVAGPCPHPGCGWRLYGFLGMVFAFCALLFAEQTLATTAAVRVVGAPQRPMAIALKWIGIRVISPVFGPFSMGIIFDSACKLWKSKCGARGSCEFYDVKSLAMKMMVLQIFIHATSTVLALIARWRYRKPVKSDQKNGNCISEMGKMLENGTATAHKNDMNGNTPNGDTKTVPLLS